MSSSKPSRVVVVTLEQREDRRKRLTALLRHSEIWQKLEWWPAVSGQHLAGEELVPKYVANAHSDDPSNARFEMIGSRMWWNHDWLHMTPGSVGCALSHRAIWQSLVAEGRDEDWWLVLEDDLLWVATCVDHRLREVISHLPSEWHWCYLGWHGSSAFRLALGDNGPLSSPLELEDSCNTALGTFAYAITRRGAQVLLQPDAVFPLYKQLDVQISHVKALKAWRCGDAACLFYSAPCQLLDSDVQATWSPDHAAELRVFKLGFKRREQQLDEWGCEVSAPVRIVGQLGKPRRYGACVVVDTGDICDRLARSIQSLTSWLGGDAIMLVWYGQDPKLCKELGAKMGLPRRAILFKGPLRENLEATSCGAGVLSEASMVANFLALPSLLGLCTEDLLVVSAGQTVDFWAKSHDPQVWALPQDQCSEASLQSSFHEFCLDCKVSYLTEHACLPKAFQPELLLYTGRSWTRLACWTGELVRLALKLHLGAYEAVLGAARCVLGFSGVPLEICRSWTWESCD